MSRILLFAIFASPGLWLLACSAGKEQLINNPDLILSSRNTEALVSIRITPDQMATLPSMTRQLKFEANGEKKKTKVVYLSDILESFQENKDLDFWVVNCGDKYQSNFTPAVIESTRLYLVLEVEDQPLVDWLRQIGHPEWGPNIINIENTEGLLDPGHKNPWGVTEIIATTRASALADWADHAMDASAKRGLELFLDSCASCHQSGNGLLGGSVSTRPLALLSIFAASNETYFRSILKDPQKTNPLAEKMPSYAHWPEEYVQDLIEFLKSK